METEVASAHDPASECAQSCSSKLIQLISVALIHSSKAQSAAWSWLAGADGWRRRCCISKFSDSKGFSAWKLEKSLNFAFSTPGTLV